MIDSLERGRAAIDRHAWTEAIEALTAADAEGRLSPEDIERLGGALWWVGRPDESTEALERAFAGYSEAGRKLDAATVALTLAYQAFRANNIPVGSGWAGRAGAILAHEPEGPGHVKMAVLQAFGLLTSGQLEAGVQAAEAIIEKARRLGVNDMAYLATSMKGMGNLMLGRVEEALPSIDEAAAAATSGELDLTVASDILCMTIGACREVGDLARAAQWADEGERWMRRNGAGGYPGICRVHRAELKRLRGHWSEAEQEARQACDELQQFKLLDSVGWAHYEIGAVRLRMGDLEGAAESFDLAYEYGHDPQPGLAELQLARGEVADAARSLGRALAAANPEGGAADRATRGRLLPTQVDVAIAAGDLAGARHAVEELESIASDFSRPIFQAGALTARGELLLGEDRPSEAEPVLGQSWRLWQRNDLPYESARARLHYAQALLAEGDVAMARRDLLAARGAFERLGAALDVRLVDELLGAPTNGDGAAARPAERASRTFMFTDIVNSTDLLALIGDEAWNELIGWHDRELRAAIAQHGGEEVSHTGDGFFAAFGRAADGIDAAADIQRRLARHRREHGFSPLVRIGLHAAEATRRGRNYVGRGVHLAARVGAAADREEILITDEVVRAAGTIRFALSEPRSVSLKGLTDPVVVRAVDWR